MNKLIALLVAFSLSCFSVFGQTEKPLRIFIRAGPKTHGPGAHDGPSFLRDWKILLAQRGAKVDGIIGFPTAEQLANTDVLVMYAQNAGSIHGEQRDSLEKFLKRGGGIVVIHDGIATDDPDWFKTVVGGAWAYGRAGYFEGDISLYYLDHSHPITRDASNFDFDDEMYYNLDMMPDAHILAGTYSPDERNKHDGRIYPSVYDVSPQMWTYEKDNYRAFVCIPGHMYKSFSLPHFRAVLLRGIAWAGKRDPNLLVTKEELASLTYPEGGPTKPEEAAKKIVIPSDFNINLVASEPLIEKPISMDWDPKGRLWIAETPEYPYRKDRSRAPYDRISILEDTKHDGRMDKKTVFCDDLDLVTSMVFYRDGVIVSQAPYILWLRDRKGKGKADEKVVLYKGFGTFDTHAVISNLRWGLDGWIYATIGYTKGDIYSGDGSKHFGRVTDGLIRFKPDGSAIEQVSSKGGNTWGDDIAPDGEIFFSQANGNHIDHLVMPEWVLARGRVGDTTSYLNIEDHKRSFPMMAWTKQAYVQIDWVGNFTAAAGACIYDGGAWPDKYNYTYYVSEPTINIVHQDILTKEGVSYVASKDPERLEKEFVASTDLWFRPIHQRVGPDGALYVLDFYNQAVVHNDTRGPRHDPVDNAAIRPDRDHYFGRIWRIQHKEAKKLEIPRLDRAKPAELVKALEHPNEWVRATALRLLWERGTTDAVPGLEALAKSANASAYARIHALWALADMGHLENQSLLESLINSSDPLLRKAALDVVATGAIHDDSPKSAINTTVLNHINDPDARVRLKALIALQYMYVSPDAAGEIVNAYPSFKDPWLESAFMGVAAKNPEQFIGAALDSSRFVDFNGLVANLAGQLGDKQDAAAAARLVILLSSKPAAADGLKQAALKSLTRSLRLDAVPAWSPELQHSFEVLLASANPDLATATMPLAVRWDVSGAVHSNIESVSAKLLAKFNDPAQPEPVRARLVASLLAARQLDPQILPSVAAILGSGSSFALQKHVIESLGKLPESAVGSLLVTAYPKLPAGLQDAALNQLLNRADWASALLDALQAGKINPGTLGPVAINRLRTHSDAVIAARANKIIDQLRGPETKEKDALIAKFTPIVTQPGDPVRGKQLFTQNCAACHSFNGQGKSVAPDLTGMGAHGPAELIIHVLDPNREVEPNYYAYTVETRDGEIYNGVIARENSTSLTLKNASGEVEIKIADITSRRNTGLSLMPNGFEALGAETLRDILAYLCAGESGYRILDLHSAFTANSSRGIWLDENNPEDTLAFQKFGIVKVGDIPFEIVNPLKAAQGKNVIVLKGGSGDAKKKPQRVEIPNVNVKATRLDFLGGIGGWAYPWGGEKMLNLPAAKVTVHYADGQSEEMLLRNGVEFADWNGTSDVPGSKFVPKLVKRGQVRWFSEPLKHQAVIQSISLESFDNEISPTFVAITAETTGTSGNRAASQDPEEGFRWGRGTHVLIVGGGSSHDFDRWFNQADTATLSAGGKNSVNYTETISDVMPALKDVSVLYLCNNQPMTDPQLRKAIFDFADSGHGLLLVHPAVWYNWKDWPEYNRVLVGGGANGHDKYGEFEVTVKVPDHPVMAGVPASFKITDELYHFEVDTSATPIEVLAEGKNLATGKTYPVVWIVKHPHARIVCITLGHDAKAHELPAYQTLLQNAAAWAAEK